MASTRSNKKLRSTNAIRWQHLMFHSRQVSG
jgi:hypothetical protein